MLNEVALGNNNSGGLQTILVQPDYDGIQYAREVFAGSGDLYVDGRFIELHFPAIVGPDDWWAILGQFGLQTARTALITIRLMNEDKTSRTIYNGRAVKKEYGQVNRWDMCWYKGPRIDVIRLEAL